MTGSRIGKADDRIILEKCRIDSDVKIERAYILCNRRVNLVVGIKAVYRCGSTRYDLEEAAVGHSGELTVGENRHERIERLLASAFGKGADKVLERFALVAVFILCKLVERHLVVSVSLLVNLLELRLVCGKLSARATAVILRLEVLVKIVGDKSRLIHCDVCACVNFHYHKKLLGAAKKLRLIVTVAGIRVVRALLRKCLEPISVSDLNTHSQNLDYAIHDGRIAEHKDLDDSRRRHIAVDNLVSESVLLDELGLALNDAEEVERLIRLRGRHASLLV